VYKKHITVSHSIHEELSRLSDKEMSSITATSENILTAFLMILRSNPGKSLQQIISVMEKNADNF